MAKQNSKSQHTRPPPLTEWRSSTAGYRERWKCNLELIQKDSTFPQFFGFFLWYHIQIYTDIQSISIDIYRYLQIYTVYIQYTYRYIQYIYIYLCLAAHGSRPQRAPSSSTHPGAGSGSASWRREESPNDKNGAVSMGKIMGTSTANGNLQMEDLQLLCWITKG